jgi:hypothetical protein
MKNLWKPSNWKNFIAILFFTCIQTALWAQDSGGSSTTSSSKKVDVSVSSNEWYTSPWVWVIGAAIFILLLVALLGGGRGRTSSGDRVTVTKTVERDTDV